MLKSTAAKKKYEQTFFETIEAINKKYEVTFSDRMQKLITKIGLIMSECSASTKIRTSTFLGSIEFLCHKVIDDPSRKKFLLATSINENGNKNKHTLAKNETINIRECVHQYNEILYAISNKYNLSEILVLKLKAENKPKNIFQEESGVVYEYFGNQNIKFTLYPEHELNKYHKTTRITIRTAWETVDQAYYEEGDTLYLDEEKPCYNEAIFTFYSKKTNKKIYEHKVVFVPKNCHQTRLAITSEDLDKNNLVEIIIKVKLYKVTAYGDYEYKEYYKPFLIFWSKKAYKYEEVVKFRKELVCTKSVTISQHLNSK